MLLEINDIDRTYINTAGERVQALKGLSLSVEEGELLCLLGPTGCGKTTLLRLIAGLEAPDRGEIRVSGEPVTGRRDDVTLVFQQYSLFPWRTVLDNVAFGLEMKGVPQAQREAQVRQWLALTGLSGFEQAYPHELSGGMQQRTAVARALAFEPQILLMDEPFGALDDRTRHRLQSELLEIRDRTRKTLVFVTHSIDEALYLADRIVLLRDRPGRIEAVLNVGLARPRDRRSEAFNTLHAEIRGLLERIIEFSHTE